MMERQFTIRLDEGVDSQELLERLRERFTDVWAPEMIMQTEGTLSIIKLRRVPIRERSKHRSRMWYWLLLREVRVAAGDGELCVEVELSHGLWRLVLVLAALLSASTLMVYGGPSLMATVAIIYPVLVLFLLPPALIVYGIMINTVRDWIVSVLSEE